MKIIKNFRHIGIVTDNLERSVKFYKLFWASKQKLLWMKEEKQNIKFKKILKLLN